MQQIHGGDIEKVSKLYNLDQEEILDFSANVNFLGPPPGLKKELFNKFTDITQYPEPGSRTFKNKLAQYLNLDADRLIITSGAVALIYLLVKVLTPKKTMILVPSFSEYEFAAKNYGSDIKYITLKKEEDFKINIQQIITNLKNIDLLFLCNPNNPTGVLTSNQDIEKILNYAEKNDVKVVVDEAFIDFVDKEEKYSVINQIESYSGLFILRSMTKFYAIPGLRLGYGIGEPEIINEMEKNSDPWNVNTMAQLTGKYVLSRKKYQQKTKEVNKSERKYLYQQLKKIPELKPYQPSANFIFIDISKTQFTAAELTDILAKKAILIRNCNSYHSLGEDYIRIAVKNREENNILLNRLISVLDKG